MPMLDLNPRYRAMLGEILEKYVPGMEVWAYGSRVNGNNHDASDLDLVVRNPADPDQKQENLTALRAALADSNLPIRVQAQDWARIPAYFREEIEKGYVVIGME